MGLQKLFVVGILIGMSFFVRIHNLIIPIIFVLLIFIKRRSIRTSSYLLLGVLISSLTSIFWLAANGALGDFIEQLILWPLRGHAGSTYGTKALIVNFLLLLQIPFFLFLAIYVLRRTKSDKSFISILLFPTLCLAYIYGRLIPNIPVNERSFRNPLYLTEFLSMQSRQFFNFAAIGLFALILFKWKQFKLKIDVWQSSLIGMTLGALTQLYPSPDAYHVWWIAPIFMAAAGILLPNLQLRPLYPLMGALLAINIAHTVVQVDVIRQKDSSSVLSGMYGNEVAVDVALKAIQDKVVPGIAKFDCADGVYAANPNGYLATSALYVNWKIGILDGNAEKAGFLVTCNPHSINNPSGKELIWENPVLSIYQNR